MSDSAELSEDIQRLNATAESLGKQLKEAAADDGRYNELKAQLDRVEADIEAQKAVDKTKAREEEIDARMRRIEEGLSAMRSPSKASVIGPGFAPASGANTDTFMATLARSNSLRLAGSIEAMSAAKASLEEMGAVWQAPDPAAKATVGDTDAAGGYLVPNNVVGEINLQATPGRSVVDLFNTINGVRGSGVDIPWEQEGISRAVIALPGATKENSNFIVNNYSATLYTLARIFDVGNQLLRHSQGAAERLVRRKLARAFALGEDYYAIQGSGSSQPYGLLTALGTSGDYVSTFSSPADNTVAGSVASAIATAAGALENRGAMATGAVMNTVDFWRMARQGSDEAGFFFNPAEGPSNIDAAGAGTAGGRGWSVFGIPLRHTPNVPTDTLVVGDFADVDFYRGEGYRVDTSSEAGDRWDKNLTGFRGEEEIAFDARPAVYTGKFQRITNAVGA